MENKSHAFWAGLFTISLTCAIALTVFFFSADRTVHVPYDLIARSNVTGLYGGAAVRFRGLDVGRVQSVAFDPKRPGLIRIRVLVDEQAPITRSTFGTLGLQGVTGVAFVQLDDTGVDLSPLKSSDSQVAQIPMHPGLLDQLQQRGDALLRRLDKIADDVDALLSTDNRQQMMATVTSLQQAADGVSTLTQQLGPTAKQLPGAVASLQRSLDSTNQLIANVNRPDGPFITNLNKAGTAAQQAGDALASMNGSIRDLSARIGYDTLPRVDSLTEDVRAAMRSVDSAAGTFSRSPRSVLFGGAPQPAPGPGEPGFAWPAAGGR
ncbi:MlaD family protein [Paraburkholderia caballeronis]|uniref:Phospholipid/cholesterol/gamma-HCH transport system substrate-binding protein n=1 Tax=Paraburkholderia caballeronis TaxID=416943 RepID=A0A1H7HQX0_9BURK|nr:MlaD family protein [Paraburkholderia caballeronis]PXW29402.1 phospholipid/cholesterol/gamma-HCH transport system substrate-binding protein [Paraburkholderia caballeronis]PXX04661.1 phospholipid/cholesterol/gamma-HCH transport system substrate-binding protein [Paraburkholderia caballeronis]RAK05722.1 phospholipid/cholesterol/gamma-HCH transport system substrate-binding protein [Paraburkholderia caballeronis]TDV18501.1 phospholipid/cholesterol/gamma-HCH transport system substrate-binding prot